MKLTLFILPLVIAPLLEARIISSSDIDSTCGDPLISNSYSTYIKKSAGPEVEQMMSRGVQALEVPFGSLPASQQIFQQSLLGTGSNLQTNRQNALSFLSGTLATLQGTSALSLLIQCDEDSKAGVGLVREKNKQGLLGPKMLFNFMRTRNVVVSVSAAAMSSPSICRDNPSTGGYTDGPVIVLCNGIWGAAATRSSSRQITTQSFNDIVGSSKLLIVGDRIDRIRDFIGFSILHEFMHWSTYDGRNAYTIGDGNGYSYSEMVAGSSNSPAQTAQVYSFLCYGTALMQKGYNWGTDGKITQTP
ncbi:hypothetical protein F5884DRAFT_849461 [Xylogone sp. PMI_703]|nr:hypothetical protein F5884DRAFT_849461 [Xylogone sp. PMI_703]